MASKAPEESVRALPGGTNVADLARLPRLPHSFALTPGAAEMEDIASELSLSALRKARLVGKLTPVGKRDWSLSAHLGATVVQACTVTLAPVTTRIEEQVERRYLEKLDTPDAGTEVEMPEDDTIEALPARLDLHDLLIETLSLAVPLYPRADGVDFDDVTVTEPGTTPMRDEDTKPFAGLAALKAKLSGGEPPENGSGNR